MRIALVVAWPAEPPAQSVEKSIRWTLYCWRIANFIKRRSDSFNCHQSSGPASVACQGDWPAGGYALASPRLFLCGGMLVRTPWVTSIIALAAMAMNAAEAGPRWAIVVHGGAGVIERDQLSPE